MIIALIGNDGSGKTTTSKELAKVFRGIGFEVIYKHEYDYVFLKPLLKLTGKKKVEQSRKEMLEERKKSVKYSFWPVLVWLDTLLQFTFFKMFKRNSIVILDRFPYDHYISFDYLGYLTPFTKWLYMHFPKADATILLWVEPEIAYARKRDTHTYAVSFYEGQTQKYLGLADQLGLKKVNTNNNIRSSLSSIFDILHDKPSLRNVVRKRALQNKTYAEAILNSVNGKFSDSFSIEFEKRVENYRTTVRFLKEFLANLGIAEYAIFKDYGNYKWVGNDLDVIVTEADFDRIHASLQSAGQVVLAKPVEWRKSKSHSKSIDLHARDLLNIDIHTAIGWRGVDVLTFEDLQHQTIRKVKFGIEYSALSNELDAMIYAYSHVLEKGFLVHLEYQTVKDNMSSFQNLGIQHDQIKPYLSWVSRVDPEGNFPVFVPLSLMKSTFSAMRLTNRKLGLMSYAKIAMLQLFWKIRFRAKQKLPFGISQYAEI